MTGEAPGRCTCNMASVPIGTLAILDLMIGIHKLPRYLCITVYRLGSLSPIGVNRHQLSIGPAPIGADSVNDYTAAITYYRSVNSFHQKFLYMRTPEMGPCPIRKIYFITNTMNTELLVTNLTHFLLYCNYFLLTPLTKNKNK